MDRRERGKVIEAQIGEANRAQPSTKMIAWDLSGEQVKFYFMMSDARFYTVRQIAEMADVPVNTAHRVLKKFGKRGLVDMGSVITNEGAVRAATYRRRYFKVVLAKKGVEYVARYSPRGR